MSDDNYVPPTDDLKKYILVNILVKKHFIYIFSFIGVEWNLNGSCERSRANGISIQGRHGPKGQVRMFKGICTIFFLIFKIY